MAPLDMLSDVEWVINVKDAASEEDLGKDKIVMNNFATSEQTGLPVYWIHA